MEIGNITLEGDENGLVTLQCDRCKSRFKAEAEYLNNECEGEICCPICGISEELNTFFPEEVVEKAAEVAFSEAEQILANAFKGFKSKHINITLPKVRKVDHKLTFKNRDYDMITLNLVCCKKKIAIMSVDVVAGFYCPYCGGIVK